MRIIDFIEQITHQIWARKLRSFLAVAGIVWGAYAVLMLSALGVGITDRSQQQLAFISKPALYVWVQSTTIPFGGFPAGRALAFSVQDILRLPVIFPKQIAAVAPFASQVLNMQANGKSVSIYPVAGTSAEHFVMNPIDNHVGRYISDEDVKDGRRVVFLNLKAEQGLFGSEPALGKAVTIGGVLFQVIGYVPKQRGGSNNDFGSSFVPYTTYFSLWKRDQQLTAFQVLLQPNVNVDAFQKQLTGYLAYQYDFSPKDSAAISVWNSTGVMHTINTFFGVVKWFLIFCGVMTLGVGGVGVANMMYFIIQERTREIGLAMALGAKPSNILGLVLGETMVLIGLGSFVGVLLANASLSVLQQINLPAWMGTPQLTWEMSLFVALILVCTGIVAGIFPARRAAHLVPVEALLG